MVGVFIEDLYKRAQGVRGMCEGETHVNEDGNVTPATDVNLLPESHSVLRGGTRWVNGHATDATVFHPFTK